MLGTLKGKNVARQQDEKGHGLNDQTHRKVVHSCRIGILLSLDCYGRCCEAMKNRRCRRVQSNGRSKHSSSFACTDSHCTSSNEARNFFSKSVAEVYFWFGLVLGNVFFRLLVFPVVCVIRCEEVTNTLLVFFCFSVGSLPILWHPPIFFGKNKDWSHYL